MIHPPERTAERDAAVEAMLPNVPFDGWSVTALRTGLAAAGLPDYEPVFLFPNGARDMIEVFCDLADRRMIEAAENLEEARLSHRVRAIIALRLEQNRPNKEAVRRAVALLTLPAYAAVAAMVTARTVDAIWRAAGDTPTGLSFYTKRAILTAVYGSTLLFWLHDTSEDDTDTLAFLDRRLQGVRRIGEVRGRLSSGLGRLKPA
jgi:ubiquinone biosynthesis protein COQ9